MYCRNCGNVVADNITSCTSCGFNPADGNNFCPKCGHFCIPGDVECIQCKASLVEPAKLSVKREGYSVPQPPQMPPQPQVNQTQAKEPPIITTQPEPELQQPQPQQQRVETKIGPKFLASDQRYCRNCGLVIPTEATKCPFCDSTSGTNYCTKCGSGTTSSDTVCSVCASPLTIRPNIGYIPSQPPIPSQNQSSGQQQYRPTPPPRQNNQSNGEQSYDNMNGNQDDSKHDWLITLLLCIFLGYFGVHRFYTKNFVAGLIQFFTGGLCGIWWLIDLIMILTDSYTDGDGNKLQRNI